MMLRPVDASCHLFSYQVEKQHLRPTLLHQAEPLHTMIRSDKILSAWSEKELSKVHMREGHKILRNFHLTFDLCAYVVPSTSQKSI